MSTEQLHYRTSEENYVDAALELALYRMLLRESEAIKEGSSEEDERELQRMAAESMPRILAFIDRQMKKLD